jgi:hypothetical protein
MPWTFKPTPEIRAFDARVLEGLEVKIQCRHTNADVQEKIKNPSDQYVCVRLPKSFPFLDVSGWIGKVLGEKEEVLTRTIRRASLLQASNGGRGDYRKYSSYQEYFNDERKARLTGKRAAGILGAIMSRGDDHKADISVSFDDFEISGSCWDLTAPQEWYSEGLRHLPRFRFVDGFYADAANAVIAFQQKHHDDLFGERYFPTLVFPHETEEKKIREIIWKPKSTTDPIMTEQWIIFGTRCKPHEYEEVIECTYAAGGKVPIGVEWDW